MVSKAGADIASVLVRELDRVAGEISAYRDERNLWVTQGAQRNAPGTLALHLAGNLMHFVGQGLGRTGYRRDRAAEFGDRDVPREVLLARLSECRDTVREVLTGLEDDAMDRPLPMDDLPPAYAAMSTRAFLTHLVWHLGWHEGQIYYHRLAVEPPEAES